MKPEIYYDNKVQQITMLGEYAGFYANKIADNKSETDVRKFKDAVFRFISLTPDETDGRTDYSFVLSWKALYNRLSATIRDIKTEGDYNNDPLRKELSAVASALLASRRAVYWIK